ncbi:MAG: FAD-dependent thymidylate synthase [Actinopolymorphaceae bacterium]
MELVRSAARDADVLFAARVSTKGEQSIEDVEGDAERSKGLINYLLRSRHGCYDEETEVLTREGWKRWTDLHGGEWFATRSPEGEVVYQRAERLIAKPYDGPMVRIEMTHVDLLVTPDHQMWAKRRRQPHRERWELVPARELFDAGHRLSMGGATWTPDIPFTPAPGVAALVGFFIGDGYVRDESSTPSFRLRKKREIDFLYRRAAEAGHEVRKIGSDRYHLIADEEFRLLAKKCYDADRAKMIPLEMMECSKEQLWELLDGLWNSDGSTSATGKMTYATTSPKLAGQLQEVALKVGLAATVNEHPFDDDPDHYGTKPRYRVTLYRDRNLEPRVGWSSESRRSQVRLEHYRGHIYCATVPHGTLYVRRNGKPIWSGNSPFEHNSMTFHVHAPIFVFRELMRHRMASYNEESGRYRELRPVFYVPGPDRKLVQEGKPGRYEFVDGTPDQHKLVEEETRQQCTEAYAGYQRMLDAGIAREVARIVLPLTIYSTAYVTVNARSLMNFLSLRVRRDDSTFPSFPQREIEMVAEKMEAAWAELMPISHAAFERNGRVAP